MLRSKKLLFANWKAYVDNLSDLNDKIDCLKNEDMAGVTLIAPALYLQKLRSELQGTRLQFGIQDVSSDECGALTGQITAKMANDCNISYCLIGHSELRLRYQESPSVIQDKIKMALKYNITPILCIGEDIENRNKSHHLSYIDFQLKSCLDAIGNQEIVIAYEPIWSVGTDRVPSVEQIEEVVLHISSMKELVNTKIVYGGSVNKNNISSISKIKHLSGFLVGRSSVDVKQLIQIYNQINL